MTITIKYTRNGILNSMNPTLRYDAKNDILVVYEGFPSGEKSEGNADLGRLVLDVSSKGRIRGIEVVNASVFLKEFGSIFC